MSPLGISKFGHRRAMWMGYQKNKIGMKKSSKQQ
jgi:hypothetical protein